MSNNIHYLIIGIALLIAIVTIFLPPRFYWALAVSVLLICIELFSRVSKIVLIAALPLALAGMGARAQLITNNEVVYAPVAQTSTNGNAFSQAASALWNNLKSATNYAVAPYATYAPKAPTKFGGGALVIYNVNQYVGAGAGIDWLGQFNLFSGNLELKLPTHPFKTLGGNLATLEVTPFVLGGIGTPTAGAGNANGGLSTIRDIGLQLKFGHLWGGQFSAGGTYGSWSGAGLYDVVRYHGFVAWQKGF